MSVIIHTVGSMWHRAMHRLLPAELVMKPHIVLEVGKVYHASVLDTVQWIQRLGHIPPDEGKDAEHYERLWAWRLLYAQVQGDEAGEFVTYVRKTYVEGLKDTLAYLRQYPASTDVKANILPRMWDECMGYLSRVAVIAEGAPPIPS